MHIQTLNHYRVSRQVINPDSGNFGLVYMYIDAESAPVAIGIADAQKYGMDHKAISEYERRTRKEAKRLNPSMP